MQIKYSDIFPNFAQNLSFGYSLEPPRQAVLTSTSIYDFWAEIGKMIYTPLKKVRVPQSQTAALPRPQEEEETDKSKQAQTEQTYEKH